MGGIKAYRLSIVSHIEQILPERRQPIAVYMERSADMLLAVYMGIAYSGNFYSPIDVDMPFSRVDKIIQMLEPRMFITTQKLSNNIDRKSITDGL